VVKIADLWNWNGRVTPLAYFLTGVIGFAIKHNLDRALAHKSGLIWHIRNYWQPIESLSAPGNLSNPERQFFALLLLTALPFIWIGMTMTVNRLRDARQPIWLCLLFFAPVVNLLFFAVLCVLPSFEARNEPANIGTTALNSANYWVQSRPGSAILAALAAGVLGMSVTWVDLRSFGAYGLTIFVALPFVMGYLAVWLRCLTQPRSTSDVIAVVSLSVVFAGLGITAIALEGLVCLAMAAPIAWALSLMGGFLAFTIHNHGDVQHPATSTLAALFFALPALFSAEHFAHPPVPCYQVHTSMDVAAPPNVVWKWLIAFPEITAPKDWPFQLGIAYPIEARITGEGLKADRECRFSTGSFKEPILAWEPGKHFAFAVSQEPLLMKETSPYGAIKVRHLEDHDFQPERADFVLTPLSDGGTHLEGTTTYQNKMWPGFYWRLWTDAIIHSIHRRVFAQIKMLAESDVR
jgi:uncharacterized membrane protein YhaH (DUF805 family)